jgi:serine/threonine-protein kinase SRPK3
MVFEILGVNFLELIKRYDYKGVPIPLVRKLARQCLIGLDYMHRMCRIIHTDFKPENVVIGLRDEEVAEIATTGQLTTTKMFTGADHNRKLNMKVAGTLQAEPERKKKDKKEDLDKSLVLPNTDNMDARQKKNQRKKLARKKKRV